MKRIGITGGIGSGKSVVSNLLRVMGYRVYDADSEARRLMNTLPQLKEQLCQTFGDDIYADGTLDRPLLASRVFGHPEQIARLNALVHPAVREDFDRWSQGVRGELCFVESAILYESHLDRQVDEVWLVTAPESLRIERVQQRSGLSADEVKRRIAAQQGEEERCRQATHVICNDGRESLIATVLSLLDKSR